MLELEVGSELQNSVAKWPDVIPLGVPSVGISQWLPLGSFCPQK